MSQSDDGGNTPRELAAKKALHEAIEEYMAAGYESKGESVMVTGWVLQACGQSLGTLEDGRYPLIYAGMTDMSMVVAQGLKEILVYNVDGLTYSDDDDD